MTTSCPFCVGRRGLCPPGEEAGLCVLGGASGAGLGLGVGTQHSQSQGLLGRQQILEGSPDPRGEGQISDK